MRPLTLAMAAGALLVATQANAGTFPVNRMTGVDTGLVDTVAVYVFGGRHYCFYFDGWHGPGWYRCGFAWRRGLGWGGVYGWNSWTYGPWERRHGHGNWNGGRRGDRVGIDSGSTRSRSTFDTRTRSRETTGARIDSNTRVRGDNNARVRGEGNARVRGEGNTRMRGEGARSTTGRGGADVRGGGGATIQGGGNAGPSMGGSTGGGASVGGGERR